MTQFLRGKKIWIVGASEGIGEALARDLAALGTSLALSARNEDALKKVAGSLEGEAHQVVALDVQNEASVDQAFSTIMAAWGRIDILIYNAGYYEPMPTQKFDLPTIETMLDVNLRGALRVLKKIIPNFLAAGVGHIVLVGSLAGYRGMPNALGYGLSKAALIHLAENLACDLQGTRIKVQITNPGFVKTRLTDKNSFAMPQIMTTDKASSLIIKGLQTDRFEICFPWLLATLLKAARWIPSKLYFKIAGTRQRADTR